MLPSIKSSNAANYTHSQSMKSSIDEAMNQHRELSSIDVALEEAKTIPEFEIKQIRHPGKWDECAGIEQLCDTRIANAMITIRCLHNFIQNDCCQYTNMPTKKRIGSESLNAQVFLIECNDRYAAMKIMPIHRGDSKMENQNELMIAKLMSDDVMNKTTIHFPILYATGKCNDIILDNDKFLNSYKLFKSLQIIKSKDLPQKVISGKLMMPYHYDPENMQEQEFDLDLSGNIEKGPDNLRSLMTNSGATYDDQLKFLSNVMTPEEIDYIKNIKLTGDIMFSELADSDVKYYIEKNNLDILHLYDVIFQAITALIDFQKRNCIHNDLHLGNLLVLRRDGKIIILLHDFGNTMQYPSHEAFDIISNKIKFIDIKTFCTHLHNAYRKKENEAINIFEQKNAAQLTNFVKDVLEIIISFTNDNKNHHTMADLRQELIKFDLKKYEISNDDEIVAAEPMFNKGRMMVNKPHIAGDRYHKLYNENKSVYHILSQ